MTGLIYVVKSAEDEIISPTNPLLHVPTPDDVRRTLDITSAVGRPYVIRDVGSVRLVTSSPELVRVRESFTLYTTETIHQENLPQIREILEEQFRNSEFMFL